MCGDLVAERQSCLTSCCHISPLSLIAMRFFALIVLGLIALLALTAAEESKAAVCACPRNYQPLCGSDGYTYSNQCDLNCAAKAKGRTITVAKKGHC